MSIVSMDCIIYGTCVADILVRPVPLSTAVGGGRLLHVEPIQATTGGIVCNTGIAMRRLGMKVAAAGLVGRDPWGELIRGRLSAEGIDTSALESHASLATSTTAVLPVTGNLGGVAFLSGSGKTLANSAPFGWASITPELGSIDANLTRADPARVFKEILARGSWQAWSLRTPPHVPECHEPS